MDSPYPVKIPLVDFKLNLLHFSSRIWVKARLPNMKMQNIWLMSKPYFKWCRSFQCRCIGHVFKIICNGNIFHPKLFGKSNDLEHTPFNFDIFHSSTPFWVGVYGIVNCLKIPWLSQELLKLVEMYSPPLLKQKTLIL